VISKTGLRKIDFFTSDLENNTTTIIDFSKFDQNTPCFALGRNVNFQNDISYNSSPFISGVEGSIVNLSNSIDVVHSNIANLENIDEKTLTNITRNYKIQPIKDLPKTGNKGLSSNVYNGSLQKTSSIQKLTQFDGANHYNGQTFSNGILYSNLIKNSNTISESLLADNSISITIDLTSNTGPMLVDIGDNPGDPGVPVGDGLYLLLFFAGLYSVKKYRVFR
jgi:hypothetical protein